MEKHREKEVLVEKFNLLIDKINSYIQDRREGKKITHHYQVQLFIEFVNVANDIYKSSLHENEKSLLWAKMNEIYPAIKDLREKMGGKVSPIEKYMMDEKVKGKTKTIDEIKRPIERIKIKREINLNIPFKKITPVLLSILLIIVVILAWNIMFKSPEIDKPVCGENGCEAGENCNNCQEDCGICKLKEGNITIGEGIEEDITIEESIEEEIVEEEIEGNITIGEEMVEEQEKESDVQYSGKSLILFGITPGYKQGVTSPSRKIEGTSISANQIKINPIPCVNITERYTEQIEFNKVDVSEALVPEGYELLMPPFDIKCNKDNIDITINVPSNYIDVKAMKCKGSKCNPSIIKEVKNLKCGNEIVEQYLRKDDYLLPEYIPVKIEEKIENINSENNVIESSGIKIGFYGGFDDFKATIEMPEKPVPQPKNPSLMITGTPLILAFDKNINISTEITMPYGENTNIDENTIAIYANKDNVLWEYVGGEIDKEQKTVKANIEDISKYLNDKNEAEFALMGSLCISCLQSEFTKVYEPKTKTKDAVLLVHGLMSSPATFQDIINDIKLTEQPWNAYVYGYPSTKKIMENAIELADHLQAHSNEYDNIYIVAHSLGGLVAQQALYYSYEQNKQALKYSYINKVRKVILIGVPNKGSPSAEIYQNVFNHLINIKSAYNLFNLNSELISEIVTGLVTPRIKGMDYYAIAGIKPYSFNMLFFKLISKKPFDEYEPNDGIVSVTSAQYVGDKYLNDKCYNYWEINVTHTELIDDPVARSLIERIVAKEILEGINDTAIIGHNKYFDMSIESCSSEDKYIIIGKRINEKGMRDALGCKCGNGYCGEGEDEINCPSDCAVIKKKKFYNIGKYLLYFSAMVLAVLLYRYNKKRKIFKIPKRKGKKKDIKIPIKEPKAAEPEKKDEIKKEVIASSAFYSTHFDKFYNLISEKGNIRAEEAAKLLGLKKDDVIKWAKILEEYKLITIKYLIFGGIELKKYVKKKKKKNK